MGGTYPFPVKYGYATVGRVEHGPAELKGRAVFALHPHQSAFTLPADAVIPIPEGVPHEADQIIDVQPFHDLGPVGFDRLGADPQLPGDLFDAAPLGEHLQHFQLSGS